MCGKTNTSTVSTQVPESLQKAYNSLIDMGTSITKLPLQQYQGPQVAGFTPDQTRAFDLTRQASGMGLPFVNQAAEWLGQSANPIFPAYNAENMAQFQNPFQQQVIDATMANMARSDAIQQNDLVGRSISSGASPFLGDRAGVAAAELARGQALARNQTLGQLSSEGFNNAQQALFNQQQFGLQQAANKQNASQQMAGLGQLGQNLTLQNAQALLGTGTLQQELGQQQLNIPYQQFLEQQNYPYKQANFLTGLVTGTGPLYGNTQTTTTPGPSPLSSLAGLFTAGLGLLKDGGRVPDYDAGGAVPQIDVEQFTYAPPQWSMAGAPEHQGYAVGPQTYINALPQLRLEDMPAPRSISLPESVLAVLNAFPRLGPEPKPTNPAPAPTPTPSSGGGGGGGGAGSSSGGGGSSSGGGGGPGPTYNPTKNGYYMSLGGVVPHKAGGGLLTGLSSLFGGGDEGEGEEPMGFLTGLRGFREGLRDRVNNPLFYMGLGMMGSESPNALTGIGQGALAGLRMYQEANPEQTDQKAQILTDGPTYKLFYPSTGEIVDTGVPNEGFSGGDGKTYEVGDKIVGKNDDGTWGVLYDGSSGTGDTQYTYDADEVGNIWETDSSTGQMKVVLKANEGGTSLMQNLAAAGLEPGTKEYQDAILKGISGVSINMPGESTEFDKYGQKLFVEIDEAAAGMQSRLSQYEQIGTLLGDPNVYTGFGGGAINTLKQAASDLLGLDFEGVAEAQVAGKVADGLITELKSMLPGALSNSDRQFLRTLPPNIGDSPEAIQLTIELTRAAADRAVRARDEMYRLVTENGGTVNFNVIQQFRQWETQNPAFTPELMERMRAAAKGATIPRGPDAGVSVDELQQRFPWMVRP